MDTGSAWRMAWHEPDQPACCEKGRCPMSSRQARVPAAQEARGSGSLRREQPWAAAAAEARGAGTRGEPRRACPRRRPTARAAVGREQPREPAAQEALGARVGGSLRREQPWGAAAAEACGASVIEQHAAESVPRVVEAAAWPWACTSLRRAVRRCTGGVDAPFLSASKRDRSPLPSVSRADRERQSGSRVAAERRIVRRIGARLTWGCLRRTDVSVRRSAERGRRAR